MIPKLLGWDVWKGWDYNRFVGDSVTLICNPTASKVVERALKIKEMCPLITIIFHPKIHAKMVLAEDTTFISTENFGSNEGWFERIVGIHDQHFTQINLDDLNQFLDENPGEELDLSKSVEYYHNKYPITYSK